MLFRKWFELVQVENARRLPKTLERERRNEEGGRESAEPAGVAAAAGPEGVRRAVFDGPAGCWVNMYAWANVFSVQTSAVSKTIEATCSFFNINFITSWNVSRSTAFTQFLH